MNNSGNQEVIYGQPSFRLQSDCVELAVTEAGGHLAPVRFFRDSPRPVEPYYISPWQTEGGVFEEPVLRMLRGDFFCCPFGAGSVWRGERHFTHGETAHASWSLADRRALPGAELLELTMETRVRPATVTKRIALRHGENVVYTQHEIAGGRGPISLGHHATLAPPPKGRLRISTSALRFGQVSPRSALATAGAEYYALAANRRFQRLERVPTLWKDEPWADASVFPAREGFVDILALVVRPTRGEPAWTCAVAADAGYCWFSLRDPALLPVTLLWMENRGRHGAPWSGRNVCIGLEDICGYFALGLKASVGNNPWRAAGIPTTVALSPRRPTRVNYIQGAFRIPRGFDRVRAVDFEEDAARFIADSGQTVRVPLRPSFVAADAPAIEALGA